jgi:hypothetical protein
LNIKRCMVAWQALNRLGVDSFQRGFVCPAITGERVVSRAVKAL